MKVSNAGPWMIVNGDRLIVTEVAANCTIRRICLILRLRMCSQKLVTSSSSRRDRVEKRCCQACVSNNTKSNNNEGTLQMTRQVRQRRTDWTV